MLRVLFVCTQNSARSQMAETFLNDLAGENFVAESAGIKKGTLNPYVIRVMSEIGYDIAANSVDSVFDFLKENRQYDLVIKVCDESAGQQCPIFPSTATTLIWDFPDPAMLTGTEQEIVEKTRKIRDDIRQRIEEFIRVMVVHQ